MKKVFASLLFILMFTAFTVTVDAADQRIRWNEKMVGYGHATLPDTLNRFGMVQHNNDGTHKTGDLAEATSSVLTITGGSGAVMKPSGGNTTIQVKQATGAQSGFLSSADWTTFNTAASNQLTTCSPPLSCNFTTHTISIPQASGGANGYLLAADWTTFNNKQAALGFTAVPTTRTVNGHALSGNVVVSASDLTTGILGTTYGGTGVNNFTFSGNTQKAASVSGALTSTHFLKADANGNIVDGGAAAVTLDTDGTFAANSDTVAASQKATKTYVDNKAMAALGIGIKVSSANVGIGVRPLDVLTSGAGNTAAGYFTLSSNTTGSQNVALGNAPLWNNTTGSYNIGIGYLALGANTTGSYNIALGDATLGANVDGIGNATLGAESMQFNVSGDYNSGLGGYALRNNLSGDYNTAIGHSALFSQTTASNNVALGNRAGYHETGSNKLFIDNASRASEADGRAKALVYGQFNSVATCVDAGAGTCQQMTVNGQLAAQGHITTTSTAPTVGTCGSSPAVTGTDNAFTVTTGSTATTACTVTFATAWASTPRCVVTRVGSPAAADTLGITSTNTTTLVLNYSSLTSAVFNVLCF